MRSQIEQTPKLSAEDPAPREFSWPMPSMMSTASARLMLASTAGLCGSFVDCSLLENGTSGCLGKGFDRRGGEPSAVSRCGLAL
jgi:hypothetical protein